MKIENTSSHATENGIYGIDLNSETVLSINQLNEEGDYHYISADRGGKAILGYQGFLEIAERDVKTGARCGYLIKADSGEVKVDVDEISVYGDLYIQTSSAPNSTIYVRADKITLGGIPTSYDFSSDADSDPDANTSTDPYASTSNTQDPAQQDSEPSHSGASIYPNATARAWQLITAHARNTTSPTAAVNATALSPDAEAAPHSNETTAFGAVDSFDAAQAPASAQDPAWAANVATEAATAAAIDAANVAAAVAASATAADAMATGFDEIAVLDAFSETDTTVSAFAAAAMAEIEAEAKAEANADTDHSVDADADTDSSSAATIEEEKPFTIGKLYVGNKGSQGCISIDVEEIFLNASSSLSITTTKGSNDQHIGSTIRSEYLGLDSAHVCIRAGSPEAQVSLEIDSINIDNSSYVEIGQDAQVRCTTGDLNVLNESVLSLAGTLYIDAGVMSVADDAQLAAVDPHAQIVLKSSTASHCLGYSVLELSSEALRRYLTGTDASGEHLQIPLPQHLSTDKSQLAPADVSAPKHDEHSTAKANAALAEHATNAASRADDAHHRATAQHDAMAEHTAIAEHGAASAAYVPYALSTSTYVNEDSHDAVAYVNAAPGSIKLSTAGQLRLTDEHIDLNDESVFVFGNGSGCIEIDGGTISHKDITISKPLAANASSLIVAANKLTLGSESFDGATPIGTALLQAGDLCLIPNAGSDCYTLRDALVLKPHSPLPSDDDANTVPSDTTASADAADTTSPATTASEATARAAPAASSASAATTAANNVDAATSANTANAHSAQADSTFSTSTLTKSNSHDNAANSTTDSSCSHPDSSSCKCSSTDAVVNVATGAGASSGAEYGASYSSVAAQDRNVDGGSVNECPDEADAESDVCTTDKAQQEHIRTGVRASVSGKLRVEGGSIVIEMGQYTFRDDITLCAPSGNSTTSGTASDATSASASIAATATAPYSSTTEASSTASDGSIASAATDAATAIASASSTADSATASTAAISATSSSLSSECSAKPSSNAASHLSCELAKPHAAMALVSDSASAVFLGKLSATKGGKIRICSGLVDLSQAKSLELDEHAIELRDRACLILDVKQLRQMVGFEIGKLPSEASPALVDAFATVAGRARTGALAIKAAAALADDNTELNGSATAASAASTTSSVAATNASAAESLTSDDAAAADSGGCSAGDCCSEADAAAGAVALGACGARGCGVGDGDSGSDWVQVIDSTASTTIYIKGLESVSVDEFALLRKRTGHKGFFSGFSIRFAEAGEKMRYESEDILQGTPERVYHQTLLEVPTRTEVVRKNISCGAIRRLHSEDISIHAEADEEVMIKLTNSSCSTFGAFAYVTTSYPTGVHFSGKGAHLRLIGDGQIGEIVTYTPLSKKERTLIRKQFSRNSKRTKVVDVQAPNLAILKAEFKPSGVLEIGDPHKYGSANVKVYGSIGDRKSPMYELIIGPGSSLLLDHGSIHVLKLTIKQGGRLLFPNGTLFIGADQNTYGKVESKVEVLGEVSGSLMTIYQGSNHLIASYASLNLVCGFPTLNDGAALHHGSDYDEALAAPLLDL